MKLCFRKQSFVRRVKFVFNGLFARFIREGVWFDLRNDLVRLCEITWRFVVRLSSHLQSLLSRLFIAISFLYPFSFLWSHYLLDDDFVHENWLSGSKSNNSKRFIPHISPQPVYYNPLSNSVTQSIASKSLPCFDHPLHDTLPKTYFFPTRSAPKSSPTAVSDNPTFFIKPR